LPGNPIVERTIAHLRRQSHRLVRVESMNIIRASVAPASIDRLELALNRIAAAVDTLGIKLSDLKAAVPSGSYLS